jgi:hypothetical protein
MKSARELPESLRYALAGLQGENELDPLCVAVRAGMALGCWYAEETFGMKFVEGGIPKMIDQIRADWEANLALMRASNG